MLIESLQVDFGAGDAKPPSASAPFRTGMVLLRSNCPGGDFVYEVALLRLNWSYAICELFIVTIGVLIAVATSEWNGDLERGLGWLPCAALGRWA